MPPRPFPLPISVGTDIAHTVRFTNLLRSGPNQRHAVNLGRFLYRLFTAREREEFMRRFKSHQNALDSDQIATVSKHLSGRWAAKEAVIKACAWRKLGFWDIQILPKPPGNGRPGGVHALILDKMAAPIFGKSGVKHLALKHLDLDGRTVATPSAQSEAPEPGLAQDVSQDQYEWMNPASHTQGQDQTDDIDGQYVEVSISHDGEYATAVCIAIENPA